MSSSVDVIRPCIKGFENIPRKINKNTGSIIARVGPGEYYVTHEDETIETVLGSCVAVCIRDQKAGVGGLNHFMLPNSSQQDTTEGRYGVHAMELLINGIIRAGGKRSGFEVKIFGGAKMLAHMGDVGATNIEFIRTFAETEGLRISSEDVGGLVGRMIRYEPATGRARVKRLGSDKQVREAESAYSREIAKAPTGGDIELF